MWLALGPLSLGACSAGRREIARIPRYDDSWDCVVRELAELGFTPGDEAGDEGRLRLYQVLEYVELESADQDGDPIIILRGSTGLEPSIASAALDGEPVSGSPRWEVVEVARRCGPGLL